jgi:hypothetical protein
MASTALLDGTPAGTPAMDDGRYEYFNKMRDQYFREGPTPGRQRDSRAMDFVEMERFDSRESLMGHVQPEARSESPYRHAASASQGSFESLGSSLRNPYDPPAAAQPAYPPGARDPRNHFRAASAGSQQSLSGAYYQHQQQPPMRQGLGGHQQSYSTGSITPPTYYSRAPSAGGGPGPGYFQQGPAGYPVPRGGQWGHQGGGNAY